MLQALWTPHGGLTFCGDWIGWDAVREGEQEKLATAVTMSWELEEEMLQFYWKGVVVCS